jgi:IclR family acetate operon transcriptional repressor
MSGDKRPATINARLVERTFDVLFALGEKGQGCTLADLSRKAALSGATALRILRTLVNIEVVSFDAAKKQYFLGPAMYRLATTNLERNQFKAVVQPLIDQFRDRVKETICIFQHDRTDRVCVAAAPCTRELSFFIEPGSRRAMLIGAPGKVLLAYLPEAERRAFYVGLNARQRQAIEAECAGVLKTGISYSRDEIVVGGAALCAPIFDAAGLAGALTILGPSARLDEGSVRPLIAPLKAMTAEITKRLGGHARGGRAPNVRVPSGHIDDGRRNGRKMPSRAGREPKQLQSVAAGDKPIRAKSARFLERR